MQTSPNIVVNRPESPVEYAGNGPLAQVLVEPGTLNDVMVAAGVDVYPGLLLVVAVGDRWVPMEEWDTLQVLPGSRVECRYMPQGIDPISWLVGFLYAVFEGIAAGFGGFGAGVGFAEGIGLASGFAQGLGYTIGYGAAFLTTGALGQSLLTVGFSALSAALAPKPNHGPKNETPDRAYAITGGGNRLEPFSVVPRVYGRHMIYPSHAALPYTKLVGDDQFYTMFLQVGRSKHTIEKVQLGNTPIAEVKGEVQIIADGAADLQTIYASQVDEKPLGVQMPAEYKNTEWVQEVTLDSGTKLSVDLQFPGGIRRMNDNGAAEFVKVYVQVQARRWDVLLGDFRAGSAWFTPAWAYEGNVVGTTVTAPYLRQESGRDGKVEATSGSASTLNDTTREWVVDEHKGALLVINPGNQEQVRTIASNTATAINVSTPFSPAPTVGTKYEIRAEMILFEENTVDFKRCTAWINTTDDHYAVRMRRLGRATKQEHYPKEWLREPGDDGTKGDKGFSSNTAANMSNLAWSCLRIERFEPPVTLSNLAVIAAKLKANERLNGQIQDLNCIVHGWCKDIASNGTVLSEIETRNPALILYDIWTGLSTHEADRFDPDTIDRVKLAQLKERCEPVHESGTATGGSDNTLVRASATWEISEHADQYVFIRPGQVDEERRRVLSNTGTVLTVTPDWTVPPSNGTAYAIRRYRFAFDRYIQGDMVMEDIERECLAVARASYGLSPDGLHSVVWDDPMLAVGMITPANSRSFRWERSLAPVPHALEIRWVNPNKNWQMDLMHVYRDGYNADGSGGKIRATEILPYPVQGMTDRALIVREARYRLRDHEYRSTQYMVDQDWEYLAARRGQRVEVQHHLLQEDTISGDIISRRTNEAGQVTGFVLDRPVPYREGVIYGVRIRDAANDTQWVAPIENLEAETNEITLVTPVASSVAPNAGDLCAVGPSSAITRSMIVLAITPSRGDLGATVTLMDYATEVYDVDLEPLPAEENLIAQAWEPNKNPPLAPVVEKIEFVEDGTAAERRYLLKLRVRPDQNFALDTDRVAVRWFEARARLTNEGQLNEEGSPYGERQWVSSARVEAGSSGVQVITIPIDAGVWTKVDIEVWAFSPWEKRSPTTSLPGTPISTLPYAAAIDIAEASVGGINAERRVLDILWTPSNASSTSTVTLWRVRWQVGGSTWFDAGLVNGAFYRIFDPMPGTYTVEITASRGGELGDPVTYTEDYFPSGAARPPAPVGLELDGQGLDTEFAGRDVHLVWRPQVAAGIDAPEIGDEPNGADSALGATNEGDTYDLEVRSSTGTLVQQFQGLAGALTAFSYLYDQRSAAARDLRTLEFALYRVTAAGGRSIPARLRVSNTVPAVPASVSVSAGVGSSVTGAQANVQFRVTPGSPTRDNDFVRFAVWYSTSNGFVPGPANFLGAAPEGATEFQFTVPPLTTYYFRVAAIDTFDGDPKLLTPGSRVSSQVSIAGADGAVLPITTPDVQEGAISTTAWGFGYPAQQSPPDQNPFTLTVASFTLNPGVFTGTPTLMIIGRYLVYYASKGWDQLKKMTWQIWVNGQLTSSDVSLFPNTDDYFANNNPPWLLVKTGEYYPLLASVVGPPAGTITIQIKVVMERFNLFSVAAEATAVLLKR